MPPVALEHSWARAWAGAGALTAGEDVRTTLIDRYNEPQRKYHTLQHLNECLAQFDTARHLAAHPAEVEIALWFHDAIYALGRADNEEQSAVWARTALLAAGSPPEVAERVVALVMATRHAAAPTGIDAQLLVDVDLAILGAPPARFAEYESQIRAEYALVPDWLYRRKRRAVLRAFLDRTAIYSTPHFHTALEPQARNNLQRAVDALGG